jgi:hypothetical protein
MTGGTPGPYGNGDGSATVSLWGYFPGEYTFTYEQEAGTTAQLDAYLDLPSFWLSPRDPTKPHEATFQLVAQLTVDASNGAECDFTHTALFRIDLPPGYVVTSELGFMTAIPEPEYSFLAVVACLLGFAVWRNVLPPQICGRAHIRSARLSARSFIRSPKDESSS